jgi:membrane-bound lytic murein transglycosylase D
MAKICQNLELLGFPLPDETGRAYCELQIKGGTDLLAMARHCKLKWREFSAYNPAFRRYVSPPDKDSTVILPASHKEAAAEFLAKPDAVPYAGYRMYTIRSGDSWYAIGRRYGVPVSVLKRMNRYSSNIIRPGQEFMIPVTGKATASAGKPSRSASRSKPAKNADKANYTIKPGDTLYNLAIEHGVSVKMLKQANGLGSARRLQIGQRLYIPEPAQAAKQADKPRRLHASSRPAAGTPGKVYRVRSGDTVWSIARKLGISHKDILQWNNMSRRTVIRPGDTLRVHLD